MVDMLMGARVIKMKLGEGECIRVQVQGYMECI